MNIVILGAPASGKGTQAELLAKKFDLYHLSTGDIARQLAQKDARIKELIDAGKLIPEEEMTMYVINFLSKEKPDLENILFEGFPRFISQYEALEKFLKTKGDDIDFIFSLDISKEEAVRRISSRIFCQKCGRAYNTITNPPEKPGECECGGKLIQREDDCPESIKTRFEYYMSNTQKLIDYLDKKGKLIRINGERPIEIISQELIEIVEGKR
jgi:adenylate kinase